MQTKTQTKLEKLLKLAKEKGASQAEVIQMSWTDNPINFENNKLKTLESNESAGISIRLIKNNKIGIASSTDPEAFESIVNSAIDSSEFGAIATFDLSKEKLDGTDLIHQTSKEIPLEELVERGTFTIEEIKQFHKDLLISGGFDLGFGETIYLNSNGVSGKRTKSVYSTSFYTHLIRGEDFLGVYEGNNSLENFPDEKKITKKILEKLNCSRENLVLETKKYPVIFTPRAVAYIFANILSVILNGKAIQQGVSLLMDKLGKELFDKKLSFIEDPSVGTRKAAFDDEGIRTTKKELIKNGVINSFYFDLSSGSRVKPPCLTTGNGFKPGLSAAPSPNLTSIIIEGDKTPYKEMITNIEEGILVDQLLGAGQSNTLAGEFSVGIELGFKIKNGAVQGRIKNCMLAGNIFEILKNISEISKEQEWVDGAMFLPSFLIDGLTVAGR